MTLFNKDAIIKKALIPVACLVAGGVAGYFLNDALTNGGRSRDFTEKREGGYNLTNPLLECEGDPDRMRNRELRPFKRKVESYLRDRMRFPGVASASVYFRELNDGIWFSIGETERFTPASMRKVPMMIALLKQAERDPGLRGRKVRFQLKKDHNAQQTIKPSVVMTPGAEYTIDDLVRRMIAYSDNNAFMVLSGLVDPQGLDRTYEGLSMLSPGATGTDDFLSVQTYASFFRILYNATYLGKDMSELALAYLAQTEFTSGIAAGVPQNLVVAHKFGEHRDDAAGKMQLHDCGIVYYPEHPYLLCIMTRGSSWEHLDDALAAISRIVYAEVNAQHSQHR